MPSALIAEDEPLLAQALRAELARAWPELRLLPNAQDGDEAVEQALALLPELLFLDIRMPGRSGLQAAQALVEDWPAERPLPLIVFVTAYDQYALQAFEACAVDYLLKPVQPARLAATCLRLRGLLAGRAEPAMGIPATHPSSDEAGSSSAAAEPPAPALASDEALLQRLRQLLANEAAKEAGREEPLRVIQAASGPAVHMVPIAEVIYFEAADKYLRVITAEREHLIRLSLRELLPRLEPQQFWQIHRSVVVRADAIASAWRDESGKLELKLHGRPERLPVSRLYAGRFKGM